MLRKTESLVCKIRFLGETPADLLLLTRLFGPSDGFNIGVKGILVDSSLKCRPENWPKTIRKTRCAQTLIVVIFMFVNFLSCLVTTQHHAGCLWRKLVDSFLFKLLDISETSMTSKKLMNTKIRDQDFEKQSENIHGYQLLSAIIPKRPPWSSSRKNWNFNKPASQ